MYASRVALIVIAAMIWAAQGSAQCWICRPCCSNTGWAGHCAEVMIFVNGGWVCSSCDTWNFNCAGGGEIEGVGTATILVMPLAADVEAALFTAGVGARVETISGRGGMPSGVMSVLERLSGMDATRFRIASMVVQHGLARPGRGAVVRRVRSVTRNDGFRYRVTRGQGEFERVHVQLTNTGSGPESGLEADLTTDQVALGRAVFDGRPYLLVLHVAAYPSQTDAQVAIADIRSQLSAYAVHLPELSLRITE